MEWFLPVLAALLILGVIVVMSREK